MKKHLCVAILATAVALVTGHTRADGSDDSTLDWPALAAFPGTLVFYMGVRQLPQIAESLIAAGRRASEPVAIVERGTLPEQRTVVGTLQNIAEIALREEVRAPSITVVGAVAGLGEELEWWEGGIRYPLAGRTVAVTRARAQASGLARRLEDLGASVVQAPVIRIRPLPVPPIDLAPYDLVCFTSPNAVAALFERIKSEQGRLDILVNNAFTLSDVREPALTLGCQPCGRRGRYTTSSYSISAFLSILRAAVVR